MLCLDSINLSVPLFCTFLVILFTYFVFFLWNRNKNLPPGPRGIPIFGYYPFLTVPATDFNKFQIIYGNVFSFRTLGERLVVVLNGANLIKDVLVNRADEFGNRPSGTSLVSWISDGIGITQEHGIPWKEQRRFFLHTAKNFGFGKMELESKIHDEIQLIFNDIQENIVNRQEIYLERCISYLTSTIICQILFDKKLLKSEFDQEILPALTNLIRLFVSKRNVATGFMLELEILLSTKMSGTEKERLKIMKFTDDIVDEHMEHINNDSPNNYVDACLQERLSKLAESSSEGTFTIQRIKANAFNLFLEGTESVGFTTASLLLSISKYPEIQVKVQKELDNVIGNERMLSWNDRQHLPYLEATIQELFRIAAPFLISTMYSNPEETTIEGYRIPKNSILVANFGSIHFDPAVFSNPHTFNPERFLSSEGKRIKLNGPYPFGVGKRQCIGESLAQMEVFLIIGSFLQKFSLVPGSEDHLLKLIPRSSIV